WGKRRLGHFTRLPRAPLDLGQPTLVGRARSAHGLEVRRLDLLRNGARRAPTHDAIIDRFDRHDLGGRAREEGLVGEIQVVSTQGFETDGVTEVVGDLHDARLGDATKRAGFGRWWADDEPVAHDEQVLTGALTDQSVGAEHDRLVLAALHG